MELAVLFMLGVVSIRKVIVFTLTDLVMGQSTEERGMEHVEFGRRMRVYI